MACYGNGFYIFFENITAIKKYARDLNGAAIHKAESPVLYLPQLEAYGFFFLL
jgi:hypothetical protein